MQRKQVGFYAGTDERVIRYSQVQWRTEYEPDSQAEHKQRCARIDGLLERTERYLRNPVAEKARYAPEVGGDFKQDLEPEEPPQPKASKADALADFSSAVGQLIGKGPGPRPRPKARFSSYDDQESEQVERNSSLPMPERIKARAARNARSGKHETFDVIKYALEQADEEQKYKGPPHPVTGQPMSPAEVYSFIRETGKHPADPAGTPAGRVAKSYRAPVTKPAQAIPPAAPPAARPPVAPPIQPPSAPPVAAPPVQPVPMRPVNIKFPQVAPRPAPVNVAPKLRVRPR